MGPPAYPATMLPTGVNHFGSPAKVVMTASDGGRSRQSPPPLGANTGLSPKVRESHHFMAMSVEVRITEIEYNKPLAYR